MLAVLRTTRLALQKMRSHRPRMHLAVEVCSYAFAVFSRLYITM